VLSIDAMSRLSDADEGHRDARVHCQRIGSCQAPVLLGRLWPELGGPVQDAAPHELPAAWHVMAEKCRTA
jgi:hypothetical protein